MKGNGKKICVCATQVPFMRGGAEIQVENLCQELKARGFEAELINIPFKWYPEQQLLDNAMVWRMMDLNESNGDKIDLVIATKYPTYAVRHENKVTWLIHQHRMAYDLYDSLGDAPNSELRGTESREAIRRTIIHIDNIALPESRHIFAESQNVEKRLMHYNGIASEVLYHPPKNAESYYPGDYGDYILSVSRLDPIKRLDFLIRALSFTTKDIKAYFVGTGKDIDRLTKLATELGLEDRVKFLGFTTEAELLSLYANARAVFFAPWDEDYGYITLEAFLSRKPVVTCNDSGGVLEFVSDGVCGTVSPPIPEAIGEGIQTLWDDKVKCRQYGLAGYERVKHIKWDNVIAKLTQTI